MRSRTMWAISATVGLLWLAVVFLAALASLTPLARVRQAILPSDVTPYVWSWAAPWPVVLPLAGAIAVTLTHAAILHVAPPRAPFVSTWFAAVAAGAAAGMAVDVTVVFGNLITDGFVTWALDLGSRAAAGAYWGLLYGWIAGLIAMQLTRGATRVGPVSRPPRIMTALVSALAVIALVLLGTTQFVGNAATQAQLRVEQEAQEPAPADGAARPDPDATGIPVPERAAGAGADGADACGPDRATVLMGQVDAATGHRLLRLELMNFSEAPCVVEGYPDVAFGDQNDHLLDVAVTPGGSFMTTDPGATRVEVPSGGSAVAYLGWDANATHGALVARTLWAAALAGDARGSWPTDADVVAGSRVKVTAWAPPSPGPAAP